MSEKTPATKKKRLARIRTFARNLKDAYTISKRTYPWVGWALLGVLVAFLALAVVISAASGQPLWYWILMALLVIAAIDLMILSWTVKRASYSQIEGMPGAAKAVLDQLPRGWTLEENPVFINQKNRDVVWRMVGRPGVVLIVEAPHSRAGKLINEETRKVNRVVPNVAVHAIEVGTEDGQVRLIELTKRLRKLPTKPKYLTSAEITRVSQRLSTIGSNGLPIPKGMDPRKARINRRALRGR